MSYLEQRRQIYNICCCDTAEQRRTGINCSPSVLLTVSMKILYSWTLSLWCWNSLLRLINSSVENFPEFLAWCRSSHWRQKELEIADQQVYSGWRQMEAWNTVMTLIYTLNFSWFSFRLPSIRKCTTELNCCALLPRFILAHIILEYWCQRFIVYIIQWFIYLPKSIGHTTPCPMCGVRKLLYRNGLSIYNIIYIYIYKIICIPLFAQKLTKI